MIKLLKILNSGTNVPEPICLTLSQAVTLKAGTVFTVDNGQAKPLYSYNTNLPTHVLLYDANNTKDIVCYLLAPEMVFEIDRMDEASANLLVGYEYKLESDGMVLTDTLVSGSVRGALVYGQSKNPNKAIVNFACG
ncbi:MAG: hypothetical protein MJ078_01420 [Clostridia bacterium]|nr:hypothetical protein [Clostridia bacterium]